LAFILDRQTSLPAIICSLQGGVEIEDGSTIFYNTN